MVPGLHRLPQPRARHNAALRGPGRQSLRGRVRHHRQHRRQAAREGARDAAGHLGRRVLLRRHQGEGQARAQRPRPRPGVDRSPGLGAVIAAATRPSTTARRSRWPASPRRRRTRRAARSTATPTASSTVASPTAPAACSPRSASARPFTRTQTRQRDRDGSPSSPSSSSRYGLTSVHHEGGDLLALQEVRARGDLLHRVSYEADGRRARGDDRAAASPPASATSGSGSARPPSTPVTARSRNARWR